MSELPNKKELEEAAKKSLMDLLVGDVALSHLEGESCIYGFKKGAHYQHPISYAQGIKDVIEWMQSMSNPVDRDFLDEFYHVAASDIEKHFSQQLKPLETLNDEQRSGE